MGENYTLEDLTNCKRFLLTNSEIQKVEVLFHEQGADVALTRAKWYDVRNKAHEEREMGRKFITGTTTLEALQKSGNLYGISKDFKPENGNSEPFFKIPE